ncbi:MAG: CPBP family intramembrane metalloprotease [Anaerolineae bacterium]|nr:CPBP family intramembrane metalloprotease [Anaerolineae bacterium]
MDHTHTFNPVSTTYSQAPTGIQPLHPVRALLFFALPALLMIVANHIFYPMLQNAGLTDFEAVVVTNAVPMAILFAFAFGLTARENPVTPQFSQRLRLGGFSRKYLFWGIGAFAIIMVVSGFFMAPQQILVENDIIPVPDVVPLLHAPAPDLSAVSLANFVGGQIVGNWGIVLLYFVMIFFNIVGEELWWRGYILPRQELVHGRWTWLVHGLMWCGFHAFKWWGLIGLLPVCLGLSWVAQRTQSTWPGIIIHTLFNVAPFVAIIMAVLGIL